MEREIYIKKKNQLEVRLQEVVDDNWRIEMEYKVKQTSDPRWVNNMALLNKIRMEIKQLKEKYYDDNRVYQTKERARDSRLDCRSRQGEALLLKAA